MRLFPLLFFIVHAGAAPAEKDSTVSLEKLVVSAKRIDKHVTSVRLHEKHFGLTHDLNEVIFRNPGINRRPESGSMLLVNGAGPYDNRYYAAGIPVFPPSHFVTHTFADKCGTSVACVTDVEVFATDAAGRHPDGAGGVFSFHPGIWRPADPKLKNRPEFTLNYGTLDVDAAFSFPSFRREGSYQLSVKISNDEMLRFMGGNDGLDEMNTPPKPTGTAPGWGVPEGYRDLTFTGETDDGLRSRRLHLWFALDQYRTFTMPWGIVSYTVEEQALSPSWRFTFGGSNQKHLEGKLYGPYAPRKRIDRTNVTAFFERNAVPFGDFELELDTRINVLHWSGYQRAPFGSYLQETGDTLTWEPRYAPSDLSAEGDELQWTTHAGITRRFNNFVFESHALLDIVTGDGIHAYPDQAIEGRLYLPKSRISANLNVSTMRPDIRGLPSQQYRFEQTRRYGISTELVTKPVSVLDARLGGYAHYYNDYPRISPEPWNLAYSPEESTDLFARGITADVELSVLSNVLLSVVANYGKSQRIDSRGNSETFEWDLPWSIRPSLSLTFKDELLLLVVQGFFAKGLPYRELHWTGRDAAFDSEFSRMPSYRRLDFQFELRHPVENHRFLTRYDGYLHIRNLPELFDGFAGSKTHRWRNTREYTWNDSMERRSVGLDLFRVAVGVRLGIRL